MEFIRGKESNRKAVKQGCMAVRSYYDEDFRYGARLSTDLAAAFILFCTDLDIK